MTMDFDVIQRVYATLPERVEAGRRLMGRPLTLTEKILLAHVAEPLQEPPVRRKTYVDFNPDRVAMQDATAQMAILQFMLAGRDNTAVPTTIHADHLIRAQYGVDQDLPIALQENAEVYDFLLSAARRYGMGFWKPGAGIIHQVVLENYAFPGGMMIGTDSHTPNAGGLGMVAIGVGGADAVDVMVGMPWELRWPGIIGVKLTGAFNGWTSAKDVILRVAGILTVKGGTGAIVEYFGPGARTISATGKGTICNMGAEIGATTSLFPFDAHMAAYLRATERGDVAELAERLADYLVPDPEVEEEPERFYDRVIEIDLSTLEPHVVGPYTPDLDRPISKLAAEVHEKGYPVELSAALVGSCTNSSYEDLSRAADVARQALAKGLKARTQFLINPGSEQIRKTVERDGQLGALQAIGATILANACGACIGQWRRTDVEKGQKNSIINSFNRNFAGRNDANPGTHSFIASPEIVTAFALAGRLDFNPLTDALVNDRGELVRLEPPNGLELPTNGFVKDEEGLVLPPADRTGLEVKVDPNSDRLALLEPFEPWDGQDFLDMPVLLKAKGKCTTDHISPAGPWLKYRGHLDNISNNLFSGVVSAFDHPVGKGKNVITGENDVPYAQIARDYKARGLRWVAIGDENYGEGSSREHAAMEPRHLGGVAIIARSFARIHETNLKKQGMLPLTFEDPADYDKIREDDRVSLLGLRDLAPGSKVRMVITHSDGTQEEVWLNHSFSENQIAWFKAGSALNLIRQRQQAEALAAA
ncbi:MAG: aconitate hydratase [Caldilineales bacterium]|nr:aconitate hydratase [Caldilineales bacterium]MDW8318186.1 aconitate hydratase [Anaerolineae bacterium]